MRRKFIFMVLSVFLGQAARGQTEAFKPVSDPAEVNAFKTALTQETAKIEDIKADFTQVKKMDFLNEAFTSTGTLYFAAGKRLRWEYEEPYSFVFILNGSKVWMVNRDTQTQLDVHANKMFKELSELMLFGIGGTSLFENRSFDFSFRGTGKQWEVSLAPKSREMKALYNQIELIFDAQSYRMESVRMLEASGDETLIQLKNQKVNTHLPNALFEGRK